MKLMDMWVRLEYRISLTLSFVGSWKSLATLGALGFLVANDIGLELSFYDVVIVGTLIIGLTIVIGQTLIEVKYNRKREEYTSSMNPITMQILHNTQKKVKKNNEK